MFSSSVIDHSRSVFDYSRSVIDDSRVMPQLVSSFTIVIYGRHIFIVQATRQACLPTNCGSEERFIRL